MNKLTLLLILMCSSCSLTEVYDSDAQINDLITVNTAYKAAIGAALYTEELAPQIEADSGIVDYTISYEETRDGRSITTRYRGTDPNDIPGTSLYFGWQDRNHWQYLVCYVSNDYNVIVARWRNGPNGEIIDPRLRTDPFVEWRFIDPLDPEQGVEWRPYIKNKGRGHWRRN